MERTIRHLFESSVQKFGNNVMMMEKKGATYESYTYRDIQTAVHEFSAGLLSLGIKKGDRIGLISEGRNDWVIAELGIVSIGAINVPLSVKIDEYSELKFRLAHSGSTMVIVSATHAHKAEGIKHDLPDLERVILLDPKSKLDGDEILFSDVRKRGRDMLQTSRATVEEAWNAVKEDDPANICYTSGTTADPKGVTLTHRNYTANVEQATQLLPLPPTSRQLIILPWDHSFGHTAGVYTQIKVGGCIASVQTGKTLTETLKNIPVNIREVQPTLLMSVPALAKNFRKGIENGIREKGEKVERLFARAMDVAYEYNGIGIDKGKGVRKLKLPLLKLFDALIFSKIRKNFGGKLEFFIGGGAYLDIEVQKFFYAIGMPIYQGYGLTEAAPIISANVPKRHKLGTSGNIMPNIQLKIVDESGKELPPGSQGEIVVKGENVMQGYWNNPKATSETIRDGWLHTGDLGYVDEDGFVIVLGRQKSLLISQDGEKYSPEAIEETIVAHSLFVDQAMLHNDHSQYTVGLLVPNREAILKWLSEKMLSCYTDEGQEAALKLLESQISEYRKGGKYEGLFPERWLPSAVAVLGEGFTEQNRMLNSTLKMVRKRIREFYQNRIDYMFTAEGKNILNHQNKTIIKRFEEER